MSMIWDIGSRVLARTFGLHSILILSVRNFAWLRPDNICMAAPASRRVYPSPKADSLL